MNLLPTVILCGCGKFSGQKTEAKTMSWKLRERDNLLGQEVCPRLAEITWGFLDD